MPLENSKIFNDNETYLTLVELSKAQKYSLEFLLKAAVSGKLKAFKFGDDWLTTIGWFEDYHSLIRREISLEIERSQIDHHHNKWVEFFTGQGFGLVFKKEMFSIILIFSVFSLFLSWLVFSYSGQQFSLILKPATDQKYQAANQFLSRTISAYNYGLNYFIYLIDQSKKVAYVVFGSSGVVRDETAYWSLVLNQKLEKYKVSDELLTVKINHLAKTLKNQYQTVAGESEIRQQIYFQDWKNSLSSTR